MTIEQLLEEIRTIRKHAHFAQCDNTTLAAQLTAALEAYTGAKEEELPERAPKIGGPAE